MQTSIETQQPFCRVTLPLPPGINQSYKIVTVKIRDKKGNLKPVSRIGATPELEAFKEHSELTLNQQRNAIEWDVVEKIYQSFLRGIKTPLGLELTFYYPTLWLHDVDGGIKASQDAICKHLGINDNQIVELHVCKFSDRDNPRVEARLFLIERDVNE